MSAAGTMTPTRTSSAGTSAGSTWDDWVTVLERALGEYGRQLDGSPDDGSTGSCAGSARAGLPVFAPVPLPLDAGALPAALVTRLQAALSGLEQLTRRTELRRDQLASQLAALPRPRPRAASGYDHDMGGSFDVCG